MKNKVFITGLGIISPLGSRVNEFWNNCLLGKSGIKEIKNFDVTDFPIKIAGEIKDFDPLNYINKKKARQYSKYLHYIIAAVKEAIDDAKIIDFKNVGIVVGTGLGGFDLLEETIISFKNKSSYNRISPLFIPMFIPNACSSMLSIEFKINGPSFSVNTACASSNHAIILGFNMIKMGYADIVIVGGTEAPIHPFGLSSFENLGLSKKNYPPEQVSRPFDKNRDGFVLSEGAGVMILESQKSAMKRNIFIYAELIGGSMSSDHYHITSPEPDSTGILKCLIDLTKKWKIPKEEINYINSHGTSTKLGDIAEQKGIQKFFGKKLSQNIKINSTKSMIGHMLGAASIVEAIATVKSIQENKLHPTINYETKDPECNLDCVPNKGIDYSIHIALSNGFGFGGQNSIIAMKSYYEK